MRVPRGFGQGCSIKRTSSRSGEALMSTHNRSVHFIKQVYLSMKAAGSIRGLGYRIYRGLTNWVLMVHCIFMYLKFGYTVLIICFAFN